MRTAETAPTPRQIFESTTVRAYNTWDAAFPEAMARAQQYLDALKAERVADEAPVMGKAA